MRYKGDKITIPKDKDQRRLHKALLRYHDPDNWGFLRESLVRMNKANLIDKLIPAEQTKGRKPFVQGGARQKASANKFDKIPARSPRGGKPAGGKRKGPRR
ncbi:radical SAM family protein [Simiduia agarivorans SA1 = DSM 21679]|uniref:Radical SAM family protein n=1 Tax=Simiduia agarivorans (strain DSM 21679 / JCM 13881 / BCRC 17597 / SA1) TaxID=1117647 RepID=K4KHF2_SIMAS|nr:radical SAM family protein [Simiduia agarivorans SA1 = DSM 21679]